MPSAALSSSLYLLRASRACCNLALASVVLLASRSFVASSTALPARCTATQATVSSLSLTSWASWVPRTRITCSCRHDLISFSPISSHRISNSSNFSPSSDATGDR